MTILYTDGRNTHRIDAEAQAPLVLHIAHRYMLYPAFFDILHIDLRGDIEDVSFYDVTRQERVGSMGGASAWAVYRDLSTEFPEINHHFRQPAPSPPPVG